MGDIGEESCIRVISAKKTKVDFCRSYGPTAREGGGGGGGGGGGPYGV